MLNYVLIGLAVVGSLVLLITLISIISMRHVVPTNMVHIVQSRNKTTSFGKGRDAGNSYYKWPSWIPMLGVSITEFPESVFDVSLKNYDAYDQGRLPFIVDIMAFFRISDSDTAAHRVASFQELHDQLTAVLQGAVRRILSTNKLEHIMESRSELGEQFTTEVDAQLKEWGVATVKTIEFMDLRDSKDSHVIANMMSKEQSRIQMESRVVVAQNEQAAELAEIDAKRSVEVQRQDAEQQVGLRSAERSQIVGIAQQKAEQAVKSESKNTTEKDLDIEKVKQVRQAEIARDVQVVQADQNKQTSIINAEAKRETTMIEAEASKSSSITIADGKLASQLKDAEAIAAIGRAKAESEAALLMAPVTAQTTLAKEIGENEGYQKYLVTIRQVEASEKIGIESAKALQNADLKVIANSGDVQSGVSGLGDLLTSKGGTNVAAMLAGLSQTEVGKSLVNKLTGNNASE